MPRRALLTLLIALALLGCADSLYLAGMSATGSELFCDIGAGLDGCNVVAQSPYSQFLGIPLAYFGVAFYALLLLATLLVAARPRRALYQGLVGVAVVGALFSVVFLYIQFVLIQAVCVYCLVSAFISFAAVPFSVRLLTRYAPRPPAVIP